MKYKVEYVGWSPAEISGNIEHIEKSGDWKFHSFVPLSSDSVPSVRALFIAAQERE